MLDDGTLARSDVSKFANMFDGTKVLRRAEAVATPHIATTSTQTGKATAKARVSKATGKKRGRVGDRLQRAYAQVPRTPVPAAAFIESHGVSIHVMRQAKRFDPTGYATLGPVRVIKNKTTKVLEIWRDEAPTSVK